MTPMGRAILFCFSLGLGLVALVWGIEFALGAPEGVYGVSELACMAIAAIVTVLRYIDDMVDNGRDSQPRGKTAA
jgi:hypothetical protein